ncbi:hypothetical protein CMV_003697 [Castanea mollissima]|uniref:Uncharacterized protein n=1 Tax=Castanea mollissima TaxID=60419 RepID=A0A8J4RGY8_9ROSI|nr:hypothetical protein CMV_003697 [Castanea mollissima]
MKKRFVTETSGSLYGALIGSVLAFNVADFLDKKADYPVKVSGVVVSPNPVVSGKPATFNISATTATTNQQLIGSRNWMMDKTAQIIERSKKVTLFKKVWNHCKRKINYLSPGLRYTVQDNINVGTETAAALKAQLLNPNNKDIGDIPGLAPPAMTRELLWNAS